jgi:hypothetical protein
LITWLDVAVGAAPLAWRDPKRLRSHALTPPLPAGVAWT